jgi:hypothetical protein
MAADSQFVNGGTCPVDRHGRVRVRGRLTAGLLLLFLLSLVATSEADDAPREVDAGAAESASAITVAESATASEDASLSVALPIQQRQEVEQAVDKALKWLATKQQKNGSFEGIEVGQPGITGLCVMAYLSRGHIPGEGPYGKRLEEGIAYVISCQHPDGLLCAAPYHVRDPHPMPHAALYNHGIAGLMLGEVYGMVNPSKSKRIRPVIEKAVAFSRKWQFELKRNRKDNGGWRYLRNFGSSDSDVSVTAWQLMFYRSVKNAGFEIPVEYVNDAVAYVSRCFDEKQNVFVYGLFKKDRKISRAMTGAGILSLSMAGRHNTKMVQQAGQWVLEQSFEEYNGGPVGPIDRYHYSVYYCSQAMFQLGGEYWAQFYPPLVKTLLEHQRADGAWEPESNRDTMFGNAYTTALTVLALTPPYQLLPISQR